MKISRTIKQVCLFLKNYSYYRNVAKSLLSVQGNCHCQFDSCSMFLNKNVADILAQIKSFSFLPNSGNLGDFLIAQGEYNFFQAHGLSFEIFDERSPINNNTLVYGGGGVFVPFWDYSSILNIFRRQDIEHVIILPSSFYQCPDLVEILDERFIIFCRDHRSYDYLLSAQTKARILSGDDMALVVKKNRQERVLRSYIKARAWELFLIDKHLYQPYLKIYERLKNISYDRNISGIKTAYFMRGDSEAEALENVKSTLDISLAAVGNCRDESFTAILASLFLSMIGGADIVVSDRLHVCIGAALLGKTVLMVDNAYKKLSGVYAQSLVGFSNIRIINKEDICREVEDLMGTLEANDGSKMERAMLSFIDFAAEYLTRRHPKQIKKVIWSD